MEYTKNFRIQRTHENAKNFFVPGDFVNAVLSQIGLRLFSGRGKECCL